MRAGPFTGKATQLNRDPAASAALTRKGRELTTGLHRNILVKGVIWCEWTVIARLCERIKKCGASSHPAMNGYTLTCELIKTSGVFMCTSELQQVKLITYDVIIVCADIQRSLGAVRGVLLMTYLHHVGN